MIQVTMREWNVLTFIQSYVRQHGYSPSFREIKGACGIGSTETVHAMMDDLEEAGLVSRRQRRARTVALYEGMIGVAV